MDLVAIPYSSGMLLLPKELNQAGEDGWEVAIPYSSGMLLLRHSRHRGGRVPTAQCRNPLFIGNAFATGLERVVDPGGRRRNPLFIGNAFATTIEVPCPSSSTTSRNPLFIGNAFATRFLQTGSRLLQSTVIPCRNPLFIGNVFATGCWCSSCGAHLQFHSVAIPYSSGMFLLLASPCLLRAAARRGCRNPLFIGNVFATSCLPMSRVANRKSCTPVAIPYSSGMFLLPAERSTTWSARSRCRNPLFIGNAFATRRFVIRCEDRMTSLSQSPIHRECFCYSRFANVGNCVH